MSLARYSNRRDANEPGIVKCLERCGAAVWRLDVPADLLIFYRGKWQIAEVKDGAKPPSARKLTEDQERAHASLPANAIPILTCLDDALRLVAAMGRRTMTTVLAKGSQRMKVAYRNGKSVEVPNAHGMIYTYAKGTSTPIATYQDESGTINSNPIILDGDGKVPFAIMVDESTKIIDTDSGGEIVATND